jgi:3-phenylpropionate/trans-cinnamate dioxygenase ferredoxin reductase subunit
MRHRGRLYPASEPGVHLAKFVSPRRCVLIQTNYSYAIVGGGLAAESAIQGIRELNKSDPIVLLSRERDLPYDRPPLSKKLWLGKGAIQDVFTHDEKFYHDQNVDVRLGVDAVALDSSKNEIRDSNGAIVRFSKLLLATGGIPRVLAIPGGSLAGVCYYRYLDDYRKIRDVAAPGKTAVVIGGGFIGSEMAAALSINKLNVTMLFPDEYLVHRVFPESLGRALQDQYLKRGVQIFSNDVPVSFEREKDKFITRTKNGQRIESDIVIVGVGINPCIELAQTAGLTVGDGIIVNEYLQTSHPDIFSAGDNTNFPYLALNQHRRVEHWDNALNQGKQAGRNMAGAKEPYSYMPYFFSDLFEFGYEAVGEVDAKLEVVMDWQKENDTGVIYYVRDGILRGAMMCNVWNKVDWARELIRKGQRITPKQLPKVA